MNFSAPASVPDALKQTPGFAPRSTVAGAATKINFHSALKDLLPAEDPSKETPSGENNQGEAKALPTGVTVPLPAPETLPFQFAMPLRQVIPAAENAGKAAPSNMLGQAVDLTLGIGVAAGAHAEFPQRPAPAAAGGIKSGACKPGSAKPGTDSGKTETAPRMPAGVDAHSDPGPTENAQLPQAVEAAQRQMDQMHPLRETSDPTSASLRLSNQGIDLGSQGDSDAATGASQLRVAVKDRTEPDLPNLAFTARITSAGTAPVQALRTISLASIAAPQAPSSSSTGRASEQVQQISDSAAAKPVAKAAEAEHASDRRNENGAQGRSLADKIDPSQAETPARAETIAERTSTGLEAPAPALTANPAAAPSRPVQSPQPAEIQRIETEAITPAASAAPPAEAHAISLRVGDGNDQRVELRVTDRGGEVRVAVRTSDTELAAPLRQNLGDLVHKLEQSGFRAETWHPAQSASMENNHRDGRSESESFTGNHSGEQQQRGRERREQDPERARWMQEIESSMSPDSEGSVSNG